MKTRIAPLLIVIICLFSSKIVSGQINKSNKQEFDSLRQSLIMSLDSCYYYAKEAPSSGNVWFFMSEGQKYYNRAYDYYQKIKQPKFGLSQEKLQLITNALSFYRRGFQQIGNPGYLGGDANEAYREKINKDIDGWPYKETEDEKNLKNGIIKLNLPINSLRGITLPPGTWCIWKMSEYGRIWVDGTLPNYEYSRWDVFYNKLPVYLGGNGKFFKIINACDGDITVIFKKCPRKN